MRHRQRPQKQSIDQREDCCIRAHAKSKRQHCDKCEARRFQKLANREPQVAPYLLYQRQSSLHSICFLCLRQPAKLLQRRCTRLLRIHAALEILFDGEIDVRAKFFVEVCVELSFAEERRSAV
jgi:hypothetical protein